MYIYAFDELKLLEIRNFVHFTHYIMMSKVWSNEG